MCDEQLAAQNMNQNFEVSIGLFMVFFLKYFMLIEAWSKIQ